MSKKAKIEDCQTAISGPKGEKKRTNVGKCQDLKDLYGNFQPTSLHFSMTSDLPIDLTKLSMPHFILESNFGVTDTKIVIQKVKVSGNPFQSLNHSFEVIHFAMHITNILL